MLKYYSFMYVFTQALSQVLSGVELIRIQSFLSPIPLA